MAINLGFTEIRAYGLVIAFGIVIAFFMARYLFKKLEYREEVVYELLLLVVPLGIIGARLFYVLFSEHSFTFGQAFNLRTGGMAIYGGVIFGALAILLYSRIRKSGPFATADVVAVVLILAQSIGRWGNFFNSEAYGLQTSWHFFPLTVMINESPHLATFFYESFLNFLGFILLLRIFTRQKKFGTTTAAYLIYYGIVRAVIEPLRLDSLLIFGTSDMVFNRISFVISLVIIILGVIILWLNRKGLIPQDNAALLEKNAIRKQKTKGGKGDE